MRKAFVCAFVILLVCGVTAVSLADYYATKADYRIGRLTPGGPSPDRAGTDDCVAPTSLSLTGGFPVIDPGDTTGATSIIDAIPLACNGVYTSVAGPDHIYTFDVGAATATLSFQVTTSDPDYDPSIYVVTTCGDGTTCVNGAASDSCFAVNQAGNPCGANSDEAFGPVIFPQGTFFFVVDSFYQPGDPSGRDVGPYALTLLPVELMTFTVE